VDPLRRPGPHFGPARVEGRALGHEGVPGQAVQAMRLGRDAVQDHHGLQLGQLVRGGLDLVELRAAGREDPAGAAVLEDVGRLFRGEGVVDGHAHQAQQRAREVRDGPGGAVVAEDADPVPLAQAPRVHRQAEPLDLRLQFLVGDRLVGSIHLGGQGIGQVKLQTLIKQLCNGLNQRGDSREMAMRMLADAFPGCTEACQRA